MAYDEITAAIQGIRSRLDTLAIINARPEWINSSAGSILINNYASLTPEPHRD
jgi:hypothetical protein